MAPFPGTCIYMKFQCLNLERSSKHQGFLLEAQVILIYKHRSRRWINTFLPMSYPGFVYTYALCHIDVNPKHN
jgi:hypothetical protein